MKSQKHSATILFQQYAIEQYSSSLYALGLTVLLCARFLIACLYFVITFFTLWHFLKGIHHFNMDWDNPWHREEVNEYVCKKKYKEHNEDVKEVCNQHCTVFNHYCI